MSLRQAVVAHVKNQVSPLGGRVYQAFLAPADVQRPYATVKLAGVRGARDILYAGDQSIEVYIYQDQDCFTRVDALRQQVIKALNGIVLFECYPIRWVAFGGGDFVDEERKLIGCVVVFEAAIIHERR